MSEIQRYALDAADHVLDTDSAQMVESDVGDWVAWEDVEGLEAEVGRLREQRDEARGEVDQLLHYKRMARERDAADAGEGEGEGEG